MTISFIQLAQLLIYLILLYATVKVKKASLKIFFVSLIIVVFALNPVRFKQDGGEKLERNVTRFNNVPEKVIVKEESFEDSQTRELNKLKQESEGLKNEIHN